MATADTCDEVKLYPARIKVFLLGVIFAAATAGCATGIVYGIGRRQGLWLLLISVLLFLTLACGYAALYYLAKAMLRKPALELSPAGITDRTVGFGALFIPWEQIAFMTLYRRNGSRAAGRWCIGVILRDTRAFMARQPPLMRWLMWMGRMFGGYPIDINLVVLAPAPQDVWTRIDAYRTKIEERQCQTQRTPTHHPNPHSNHPTRRGWPSRGR